MRQWTINGRFASQPVTGVQRYAGQIVRAIDATLAAARGETAGVEVELLVPPGTELAFPLSRIRVRAVGQGGGHLWEQVHLIRHARGGLLSLANTGPVAHPRQIVCIHDTNTRTCPESYAPGFRALYRTLHPLLGRTAHRIATVSHFSAAEIVRFGIAPAAKIVVAPNGHEHALDWQPDHTEATRAAAGPATIVVLGSRAPHKNIALLLGLAPRLEAAGLQLAIVGLRDGGVFASAAAATDAQKPAANVHWLGRVSDAALAALLRDSLCLAFPSLTEGFGLPPLEAMARGCPVVVTDRASLPEICGAAALYAPPDAPELWLAHFKRLRADPAFRTEQIERGRARAAVYSWQRTAATYLAAMAQ